MFDLDLSEEQSELRAVLNDFALKELRPVGQQCDADRVTPEALDRMVRGLGVTVPTEGGLSALDYVIAAEELSYGDPGVAYGALATDHAALLLALCGSPEQQAAYLPALTSGGRGSVMYYEGWGRGANELEATAVGDSTGWNLNGEKFFVANPAASVVSVVCAVDTSSMELRAFLVEGTPEGIVLGCDDRETPNSGLRAAHTGAIAVRHVRVPRDAVLPARGPDLWRALAWMRLTVPAVAIGAARAANEYAAQYAQERVAFGRPIAAFQGVAFLVADADTAIDTARLALWSAVSKVDGMSDAGAVDRLVSSTVSRVCAAMERVTRDVVQVLGGSGYVKDHPVEHWWRSAITLAAIDTDPLAVPAVV